MNNSTLVYPHTHITSFLSEVAKNSTRWGAKAKVALDEYKSKRNYWTSRIAELESVGTASAVSDDFDDDDDGDLPEYPHTNIIENVDRLRKSLNSSTSPDKAARLALLDAIEADYGKKRQYLQAVMDRVGA